MILQALKEYYDRKSADPDSQMAPPGFEWKEIPFVVVLSGEGMPVNLYSTFEGEGKKRRAKRFLVPQAVKKTSGIAANLLWDNPEYALGIPLKGSPERVAELHRAFIERMNDLGNLTDDGLSALKKFLLKQEKECLLMKYGDVWRELMESGRNVTFQLAGDFVVIAERPVIRAAIAENPCRSKDGESAICLVTGQRTSIERLHTAIKGVWNAQSSGANIVSFNLAAFRSFGKEQGSNAPVGKEAAFAYTTALNHLLGKDSRQRFQVGDSTTVFWAERRSNFEQQISDFFGESPKDDPDRGVREIAALFHSVESGTFFTDENRKNRFFVLGLAPNASRIAVRFWIVNSVAGMAEKICSHFRDTRMAHGPKDRDTLSLFRLLVSTAVQEKADNILPNLGGETMRAILEGLPYPRTLLQAVIRRIRAEHEVSYPRAALIKACINRVNRYKNPDLKEELKMSLDEENTNVGYRLGRLFAVLEKIQQEANPGINATIRDRFYGAASGTPVTVFGNLMRLKNHHLAKLESPGRRVNFEKLLTQIIGRVEAKTAFPAHLSLDDQGRFAIGYYHQIQSFFQKKDQSVKKGEEE